MKQNKTKNVISMNPTQLVGFGCDAVYPWVVFESLPAMEGLGEDYDVAKVLRGGDRRWGSGRLLRGEKQLEGGS